MLGAEESCNQIAATTPAVGRASKRAASTGIRKKARPFRRLDDKTLQDRLCDMEKKRKVLQSKLIMLEDRLEQYNEESQMRLSSATDK